MILTVTMNPSVDTRYQLDELIIEDRKSTRLNSSHP